MWGGYSVFERLCMREEEREGGGGEERRGMGGSGRDGRMALCYEDGVECTTRRCTLHALTTQLDG